VNSSARERRTEQPRERPDFSSRRSELRRYADPRPAGDIRGIRTAISQNRHSLRRFFCPRNTRIDANPVQVSREALWECGASSARGITRRPSIRELGSQYPKGLAPLFVSVRFDPKRLAAASRTPNASPNRAKLLSYWRSFACFAG
jgi:hypothetical protein